MNSVLIRGFPKATTQKQVDCIREAFSENEGHCNLMSIDLYGESLGIVLQFEMSKHAEKVVKKYRKSKFLGYCISAQYHCSKPNMNNIGSIPHGPNMKNGDVRAHIDRRNRSHYNSLGPRRNVPGSFDRYPSLHRNNIPVASSDWQRRNPNIQHRKENHHRQDSCGNDSSPESRYRSYRKPPYRPYLYNRQKYKFESKSYVADKRQASPKYFARRTDPRKFDKNRLTSSTFTQHGNTLLKKSNGISNDNRHVFKQYSVEKSKSHVNMTRSNEESCKYNMQQKRHIVSLKGSVKLRDKERNRELINESRDLRSLDPTNNVSPSNECPMSPITRPNTPLHDEPMETTETDRSPTPVVDEIFYPISDVKSSVLESIEEKSRPNTPVQDEVECNESVISPSKADEITLQLNETDPVTLPQNEADPVTPLPNITDSIQNKVDALETTILNESNTIMDVMKLGDNVDDFVHLKPSCNKESTSDVNQCSSRVSSESNSPEESKTKDLKRKLVTSPVNIAKHGVYGPTKFQPTMPYLDGDHRKSKKLKRASELIVPTKIYKGCTPKKNVILPRLGVSNGVNENKSPKISSAVFTPVTRLQSLTCSKLQDSTVQDNFTTAATSPITESSTDQTHHINSTDQTHHIYSTGQTHHINYNIKEIQVVRELLNTVTDEPIVQQPVSPTVCNSNTNDISLQNVFLKESCSYLNKSANDSTDQTCAYNSNAHYLKTELDKYPDGMMESCNQFIYRGIDNASSITDDEKVPTSSITDDEKIVEVKKIIKHRISDLLEWTKPTCALSLESIRNSVLDRWTTVDDFALKELLKEMIPTLVFQEGVTESSKQSASPAVIVRGIRYRCDQKVVSLATEPIQTDASATDKVQGFANDCRAVTTAVKLLITKNPDLENRLISSCKDILQELSVAFKRTADRP